MTGRRRTLSSVADTVPQGLTLRFRVQSQSRAGEDVEKLVRLTMKPGKTGTRPPAGRRTVVVDCSATRS